MAPAPRRPSTSAPTRGSIIPALVEILAVQIPGAAAAGGMFAGVNTILQAAPYR